MKIAIVVKKLTGGGAERVAAMWGEGLYRRGHNVQVIVTSSNHCQTYRMQGINPIFLEKESNICSVVYRAYNKFFRVYRLHRVLRSFDPDVVLGVMGNMTRLVIQARRDLRYKIVSTEHNVFDYPNDSPMSSAVHRSKFIQNKKVDLVTVLTFADIKAIGDRLSNVVVLPNPVAFEPVRQVPVKKNIILSVGRVDDWHYKGFDLLLKAWGQLCEFYPEWELYIVGAASEKSRCFLNEIAKDAGCGKRWKLFPYTENIQSYYREASIFCLSSRYEAFGLVLIEAMSMGCACVAADYKGRQSEIFGDEENGITCSPADCKALSDALKNVLEDTALRSRLQQNAPVRARSFSIDSICERLESELKRL